MRDSIRRRARTALVAAALLPAFALAACTADQSDLQNKIKDALNGNLNSVARDRGLEHADSVSCPSNVQLKSGTMFDCTVTGTDTSGASGAAFTFRGEIVKDNNIQPIDLTRNGGATPATPSTSGTTTT